MNTKAELLRKLETGDISGVIQDLIRLFQRSSDEKLESLLKNIILQYDDLTKLIRDNNLTVEQRTQRESIVNDHLKQIIEQLKEPTPKYIWLILGILLLTVLTIGGIKQCPSKTVEAPKRDTFRLCLNSDTSNYVISNGIQEMIQEIHQIPNQRLTLLLQRNFNGSEAGHLLNKVRDGKELQMFHSISYYWNQSIPASLFFAAVPFGMNKEEMEIWLAQEGAQLWRALYHKEGVIPFALGHTGQQWGGWFNKEMKNLSDFKGLMMRMGGEGGKILKELGAKNNQDVPTLSNLDSIFRKDPTNKAFEWIGPSVDYKIGLHKYFKYYYQEGWHEPNTLFSLYINEAAWEKVKDIQPLLENIIQKYNNRISSTFQAENNLHERKLEKEVGKNLIQHFPCDLLKALEIKSKEHMDAYYFEYRSHHMMDTIKNSYWRFHEKYKKDKPFPTCK